MGCHAPQPHILPIGKIGHLVYGRLLNDIESAAECCLTCHECLNSGRKDGAQIMQRDERRQRRPHSSFRTMLKQNVSSISSPTRENSATRENKLRHAYS